MQQGCGPGSDVARTDGASAINHLRFLVSLISSCVNISEFAAHKNCCRRRSCEYHTQSNPIHRSHSNLNHWLFGNSDHGNGWLSSVLEAVGSFRCAPSSCGAVLNWAGINICRTAQGGVQLHAMQIFTWQAARRHRDSRSPQRTHRSATNSWDTGTRNNVIRTTQHSRRFQPSASPQSSSPPPPSCGATSLWHGVAYSWLKSNH